MAQEFTQGLVIAAHGKRYDVELPDSKIISCVTRGKKSELACGDQVRIKHTGPNEAVIEDFLPRTSLLYRSNEYRKKLLAANVTQIIIVLAAKPSYYPELLDRCLIAAESENIRPLILLNKADLPESADSLKKLKPYQELGYHLLTLSAQEDVAPLLPWLQNQTSVLVGQSGMGKSTLVNALLPQALARTREISSALDSGKHTTTAARLYHLNEHSHLIDSPGLQEFGLAHLSTHQIEHSFIEFRPYIGKC
ncbi:MAG TPA: ribosome small subunit-dependent GTPase A, partial [Methylophilaceae bacterium]